MKANRLLRTFLILFILALNIGCDQVAKSIVRHKIDDPYTRIGFLHNHITILNVENTGAFLSLGDSLSHPVKLLLLNILPLMAVLFGLGFILVKTELSKTTVLGVILIIGGGFGNLYDRIVHGSVTDFMHIDFVIFQTGVFNVADMSIMAGTFMILLEAYFKKKKQTEPETTNVQ
jgi:signal peptidase II